MENEDALPQRLPPLEIPYLCEGLPEFEYGTEFGSWPENCGWVWTPDLPLATFAARVQCWLFFGLLTACGLSDRSPRSQFVVENANGLNIVKWDLIQLACDIASHGQKRESLNKHQHVLTAASKFINEVIIEYLIMCDESYDDLWSSPLHASLLATDALLDRLVHISGLTNLHGNGKIFPPYYTRHGHRSMMAEISTMQGSIERLGLCPSLASQSSLSSSAWWQFLIHERTVNVEDKHGACSIENCSAHNVSRSDYKMKHQDTCNGCDFVQVDREILEKSITEGKIPLLCCYEDNNGRISLQVVMDDLKHRFTAISHVWSGGLGNFENNAILQCQLRYLKTAIDGLPKCGLLPETWRGLEFEPESVREYLIHTYIQSGNSRYANRTYFWLDTLCVPIGGSSDVRKTAINGMAQIYAAAAQVLVLDPELQKLQSSGSSDEVALSVAMSPWMSRSWPLQEYAVASEVWFKLSRSYCHLGPLEVDSLALPTLGLVEHLNSMRLTFEEIRNRKVIKFTKIWNALVRRTTTEQEDIHAILATLLDRSAAQVLATPLEHRMEAIVASLDEIPLSLLFSGSSNKAENTTSISWLPRFPNSPPESIFVDPAEGLLKRSDSGFLIESSRLQLLVRSEVPNDGAFYLVLEGNRSGWRICPFESTNKAKSRPKGNFIFLMTQQAQPRSSSFLGVQLRVLGTQGSDRHIAVSFERTFAWTLAEASSTTEPVLNCEETKNGRTPLLLIEQMGDWPKIEWRREDSFPFLTFTDVRLLVWTAAGVMAAYATMEALLWIYEKLFGKTLQSFPSPYFYTLFSIIWIFDQKLFTNVSNGFVRRRWVAGFQKNGLSEKIRQRTRLPFWTSWEASKPILVITQPLALWSVYWRNYSSWNLIVIFFAFYFQLRPFLEFLLGSTYVSTLARSQMGRNMTVPALLRNFVIISGWLLSVKIRFTMIFIYFLVYSSIPGAYLALKDMGIIKASSANFWSRYTSPTRDARLVSLL